MAFNFSPTSYNARPLDFSALADVPDNFWKGQAVGREAGLRDALGEGLPTDPQGNIDWAKAASIVGQFDPELGMRTAAYAQKSTLTPAEMMAFGLKEKELSYKYPEGQPRQTASDKKARYDAEDALPEFDKTIEILNRAEEINDKTFEGAGASQRGWLGSKLPDWAVPDAVADKATGTATNEWEVLMAPTALEGMAATLKGATSNLELQRYIGFLADPSTPKPVRKNIIKRLRDLTEKQRAIKAQRVDELGGAASEGGTEDQWEVGKQYTSPDGRTGTYLGNGQFEVDE
jgi:hypothetical protein